MYLSVGHRIKLQEEVELDETFMRAGGRGRITQAPIYL